MIDFPPERWKRIEDAYTAFWNGTIDRPITGVIVAGRDPGRPCPDVETLGQANCHRFDIPAEAVVDRWDYNLSCQHYLGDAFPSISLTAFGPGVVAAMCGARLDNSSGGVWFHAPDDRPIEEITIRYDPENRWVRRIKDLYRAAQERWGDSVALSLPDLGGNLDVVQSFREGDRLPMDLIDAPQHVERLLWEAHQAWWDAFEDFHGLLQPTNRTYSAWMHVFSDRPYYMLQCDFCYMISPGMFERFVLPELQATCRKLDRSIYHLDGVGQLPHLDMLLETPELTGVQWQPGDGKPPAREWPDVHRRIHAAGKRIQLTQSAYENLEAIMEQIGTGAGIQTGNAGFPAEREADALAFLERVGVPA